MAIYGTIGPKAGIYTVQVDDGSPAMFDAESEYFTPQTLLYRCNGLGPGFHKVRFSNAPFHGQTFSIDYAVIYRAPSCVSSLFVFDSMVPEELKRLFVICRTGNNVPPVSPSSPEPSSS